MLAGPEEENGASTSERWRKEAISIPSSQHIKAPFVCVLQTLRQKTVVFAALVGGFAALIAAIVKLVDQELAFDLLANVMTDNVVFQSFSFMLGFLVIFHTSNAYTRLVKGGEMLYTVMGDFADLASLTMSFSRYSDMPQELILEFKQDIVRLLSLAFCVGIGRLEENESEWMALDRRLVDVDGIGEERLRIVHECQDDYKAEVVTQMIQSLLVDNIKNGVLSIPPPLVTRAFQELGSASIKLSEIRSYKELPFPETLTTATHFLLLIHMLTTPYFMASWCEGVAGSAGWTFCLVFSLHLLHNVARELDNPFGTDLNDIDMAHLQEELNETLLSVFVASTPEALRESEKGCMARRYRELKQRPDSDKICPRTRRRLGSDDSLRSSMVSWVRHGSMEPSMDWDTDANSGETSGLAPSAPSADAAAHASAELGECVVQQVHVAVATRVHRPGALRLRGPSGSPLLKEGVDQFSAASLGFSERELELDPDSEPTEELPEQHSTRGRSPGSTGELDDLEHQSSATKGSRQSSNRSGRLGTAQSETVETVARRREMAAASSQRYWPRAASQRAGIPTSFGPMIP